MKKKIVVAGLINLLNCHVFGIIICIFFPGCNDDSRNLSVKEYREYREYNVYFIGNSITLHGPDEKIGWFGNWGMAATSKENDYVHKLTDKILNEYKDCIRLNYGLMVTNWERDFLTKLDTPEINEIDLLIIRLGENVNEGYARDHNYYEALDKLIKQFKSDKTKIIITDNYWPSPYKDDIQKKVAYSNNYYFVRINDLFYNAENSAYGIFAHPGVARHPSDVGMEKIAERIFQCIKKNKIIE